MARRNGRGVSIKGRFILVVILASVPFFLAVTSSTLMVSIHSSNRLRQHIETTTDMLHHMIDSMLQSSVHTYLLSKVETGRNLTEDAIDRMEAHPRQREEIKRDLIRSLLSLKVGEYGYFYAVDSNGKVIFHPDESIVGTDQRGKEPVDGQIEMREGYMEYRWQNTDEQRRRKKALYMSYVPELDWILTATSYRDEFTSMIDMDSLRETVNSVSFSERGYAYVVDREGKLIAHPYMTEEKAEELMPEGQYQQLVSHFFEQNEGFTTYQWRDEAGAEKRTKMVNLKYLPDFDWIVGTSFYVEEIYQPLTWIVALNVAVAFIIAALLFLIIFRINASISRQIDHLSLVFQQVSEGNLRSRAVASGPRELSELGENLNRFLSTMEEQRNQLSASLKEKEVLLREIQHRVKNNLQTILSLINLQQQTAVSRETEEVLGKTSNSINVMAMVYDYLSHPPEEQTEDLIAMEQFIDTFIDSVLVSLRTDLNKLHVEKHLNEVYLGRNAAISCGLILNELLADSVERTEGRGMEAEIHVRMQRDSTGRVLLAVADNRYTSAGESAAENGRESNNGLVTVLSKQLGGIEETELGDFYEYRISFDNRDAMD